MYSLPSSSIKSISAPDKFTSDGNTSTFSNTSFIKQLFASHSPIINSYTVFSNCDFSIPIPLVELPCGSTSITSTFCLYSAMQAARLTAVVVFPTPPF